MKPKPRLAWRPLIILALAFNVSAQNPSFRPIQTVEMVADASGDPVLQIVSNYTYDHGNLIQFVREMDFNVDGIMDHGSTAAYMYNQRGDRILSQGEAYSLPEVRVESRSTTTYTYDGRGHPIAELVEVDSAGDGTIDLILSTSFDFDREGNLVRWVRQSDANADGTPESTTTSTRTYDARGQLIEQRWESDSDLDGVADGATRTTYTRDARGNVAFEVVEVDYDADGVVDEADRKNFAYDKSGYLVALITKYYVGVGPVTAITTARFSYEDHRRVVREVWEEDLDADGIVDGIRIIKRTLGHGAALQ